MNEHDLGIAVVGQALAIVPALVEGLSFNAERMAEAISPDMFATDLALQQAARGVPFREAYLEAKQQIDRIDKPDAVSSLAGRVSAVCFGDLMLEQIQARLERVLNGLQDA